MPGLPGTERRVLTRADRDGWPRQGKDFGKGSEYPITSLPAETQIALVEAGRDVVMAADGVGLCDQAQIAIGKILSKRFKASPAQAMTSASEGPTYSFDWGVEAGLERYAKAADHNQAAADGRMEILNAFWRWRQEQEIRNKRKAADRFVGLIRQGAFLFSGKARNQVQRGVSVGSIIRWDAAYKKSKSGGLVSGFGSRKGKTALPERQQDLIVGMLVEFPHAGLVATMEALWLRFGRDAVPSDKTVKRFRERWVSQNESAWLSLVSPDEWRNKFLAAFGSKSENITALNELWEMDSTPADLLLSDGKRHQIIGVIDIYSRRVKFLVSRTSKARAVTALIRWALLAWGVPGGVRTDNGADYVSTHVQQVVKSLDIKQEICPPFTPEAKPFIERVFKTFSHGIVEMLPGYVGHSVADRKVIEARKSFATRLMERGGEVEVGLTPEELQALCDRWTENIYEHRPHEGLDKKTPFSRVSEWSGSIRVIENERALDLLLYESRERRVRKKGIQLDKRFYIATELAPYIGQDVDVRINDADLGEVFVFSLDKSFICAAHDPAWAGISRQALAIAAKQLQKRDMAVNRRNLRKTAREVEVLGIPGEIMAAAEADVANVKMFPKKVAIHNSAGLAASAKAAAETGSNVQVYDTYRDEKMRNANVEMKIEEDRVAIPLPLVNGEVEAREKVDACLEEKVELSEREQEDRDYQRAKKLLMDVDRGLMLPEVDEFWLRNYTASAVYTSRRKMEEYERRQAAHG